MVPAARPRTGPPCVPGSCAWLYCSFRQFLDFVLRVNDDGNRILVGARRVADHAAHPPGMIGPELCRARSPPGRDRREAGSTWALSPLLRIVIVAPKLPSGFAVRRDSHWPPPLSVPRPQTGSLSSGSRGWPCSILRFLHSVVGVDAGNVVSRAASRSAGWPSPTSRPA
jgi:hypothetical protein